MARSGPSLTALLGLLAVAGYKNRDKISEMLTDARQNVSNSSTGNQPADGISTFLADISSRFTGSSAGGTLSSALNELVGNFRGVGHQETADSWVSARQSKPLGKTELEAAIGDETLEDLTRHTGLSRDELVARLTASLPEAVNHFTPEGRVPSDDEGLNYV